MEFKKPITLTVLGRSGCGKGTQAEFLLPKLRPVLFLQTGKLLRKLAEGNGIVAKKTKKILKEGYLVPTWLAGHMWSDVIIRALKEKENIFLDGAPREKKDAIFLDEVLRWLKRPLATAIYLKISEKEAVKRLISRGRMDDRPAAVRNRMEFFSKNVIPVINYYKRQKRLVVVDGEGDVKKIFKEMKAALGIK